MFAVGLRVVAGMVDNAVPMIRRRIERIELQRNTAGIDDVVIRPSRDDDRKARSDRCPDAVENRLTRARFHAEELVERVDFGPDLFLGLSAMTTSWQCFAVYSTRRNSSFLTARSSISCTKPFITTPLSLSDGGKLRTISSTRPLA